MGKCTGWVTTERDAEGEGKERVARGSLPRERDEKLESMMGRGETYETDVNFERRAREVYPLLVVETSRSGGDSASGSADVEGGSSGGADGGGGREPGEGVEGGGSRLETQVDISLEQTRHLPTIRKTFTSSVPGGASATLAAMRALLRNEGCSHPSILLSPSVTSRRQRGVKEM